MNNKKVPENLYPVVYGREYDPEIDDQNDQNELNEYLKVPLNPNDSILEYNLKNLINAKGDSILIQGDVQSGKTNTIINLIKRLTENEGYFIIFLTGLTNDLKFQNASRFDGEFNKANEKLGWTKYSTGGIKQATDTAAFEINKLTSEGKTFITSDLKNVKQLNVLADLVDDLECKILIIDDEADEASVAKNTGQKIKNIIECKRTQQCVNSGVCAKTDICKDIKYYAITATPYKNLYFQENIYDDFVVLETPASYKGLKEYKGKYRGIVDKENFTESLGNPLIAWAEMVVSSGFKNSQMLLNVKTATWKHENTRDTIIDFLKNSIHEDSDKMSDEAYKFLVRFNRERIFISNSKEDRTRIEWLKKNMNEGHFIIIGGINLSRGLTFSNLIVEVMSNAPETNIDPGVLLQKARWFGHKENYKDLRIYLPNHLIEAYDELDWLNDFTKTYKLNGSYKEQFDALDFKWIGIKNDKR